MGLGALLLLAMPLILVLFALTGTRDAHIPGTLVILSASGGMALIVAGAVIRD
jgi:hypothetical protein